MESIHLIWTKFISYDIKIQTAIIAAITTLSINLIKPLFDRILYSIKLDLDYKYEQRKLIKSSIAKHKGHLINSAYELNKRFKNFSKNEENMAQVAMNKLTFEDIEKGYYFKSFIYRFLCFFAWIEIFEKDLIYLDTKVAKSEERNLYNYLKVFPEFLHDRDLYKKKNNIKDDLIYRNNFLKSYIWMITDNNVIDYTEFEKLFSTKKNELKDIVEYLHGINLNENNRNRLDRLFGMQLMITGLLNKYGYSYQKTSIKYLIEIIKRHKRTGVYNQIRKHILRKYKFNRTSYHNLILYVLVKYYS